MVGDLDKYSPLVVLNPGSHALQCVFDAGDLKGEGKKRAKAKKKETRYTSLAIFVCECLN